ncbi:MAG: hypothetical protein BWX70_03200 [Verrucomicrobia bacterium ADurb.Bin070]|nr:MAG: hypothetical protein BWX70_03200 [Verrucomicrobia bacterium ADurb.Bin070]
MRAHDLPFLARALTPCRVGLVALKRAGRKLKNCPVVRKPRGALVQLRGHAGSILPSLVEYQVPDMLRLRVRLVRRLHKKAHVRKMNRLRPLCVPRHQIEPPRDTRAHGKHALESSLGELLCHLIRVREPRRQPGRVIHGPRGEYLAYRGLSASSRSGDRDAPRSLLAKYAQRLNDPRCQRRVKRTWPRRPRPHDDVFASPVRDVATIRWAECVSSRGAE